MASSCIETEQTGTTAIAATHAAPAAAAVSLYNTATPYTTYITRSWHNYQSCTPSHLHSIDHYNTTCKDDARLYGDHVMVLRDNITKITGYYWYSNGFPAQNCADSDGYVDVRTGKQYPRNGCTYFQDIRK